MKVVACPGRLVESMSWTALQGSVMSLSSWAKRLPEIAEMKKICTIMNTESLAKSDALIAASDTCPSSVEKNSRMIGCSDTSAASARGWTRARSWFSHGASPASSRKVRRCLSALTLLSDETKATGIVQNRHMTAVSTKESHLPSCRRRCVRPRLAHWTSLGWHPGEDESWPGLPCCTICSRAITGRRELNETKPPGRARFDSCEFLDSSSSSACTLATTAETSLSSSRSLSLSCVMESTFSPQHPSTPTLCWGRLPVAARTSHACSSRTTRASRSATLPSKSLRSSTACASTTLPGNIPAKCLVMALQERSSGGRLPSTTV
mmetsp:Transcript_39356/g.116671  ORF Transcript_39356/g.116671 Transcript_39356/m.116671 type:complete len:322 (-) Transcript_39356:674-1639(-)